jgi:hypothetical protein
MSKKSKSHITLANMFPPSKNTLGNISNSGILDINTLFSHNPNEAIRVDTDILLYNMSKKQLRTDKYYKKIFKACWDSIIMASNAGYTEIQYTIPSFATEYVNYDKDECLFYIESVLHKHHIRSKKINDELLHISWLNLKEDLYANGKEISY